MSDGKVEPEGRREKVVQIRRCACVVKGGRRFSFTAIVVDGDRNGAVWWGYGKGPEVPIAVEKAVKASTKSRIRAKLSGGTISHPVTAKFGASVVTLIPARPGTGVIAGATVRAVLECAGVTDILTKSRGSNNAMNLVRATVAALSGLRDRADVTRLRGVEI